METTVTSDSVAYYKKNYQTAVIDNGIEKFVEKSGFNTVYSHACGYMDEFQHGDFYLSLKLDGGWHVRVYRTNDPQCHWSSLDSRPEAKKLFLRLRGMIKSGASMKQIENEEV